MFVGLILLIKIISLKNHTMDLSNQMHMHNFFYTSGISNVIENLC